MDGIWLPSSALMISIFLICIFFTKKSIESNELKYYRYMLIDNLLFSFNCVIAYILAKNVGNNILLGIEQKFHLSFLIIFAILMVNYYLEINKFSKLQKINNYVGLLFIILTFILPIETINYDDIIDVGGYAYYSSMVYVISSFLMIIILNVRYYLKINRSIKKNMPFILLLLLFIIGLILRRFYPEIITETYIVAFVLLVMYFTIENPDVKMIQKLELASNEAIKANNAKSDFLSSMSHEIRTPLNAIVGLSQDILDYEDSLPSVVKEDSLDIIDASNTLLEIVGNILDINKIESNKMEIVNIPYDFKDEISSLVKINSVRIGDKPIELNVNIAEDIPDTLIGDKVHVKEIVNNLISNAIKYTDKGHINFNVKCINKSNKCDLIISVEDTGRGIKAENINKLFTKFERLDIEKNSTTEGTGLGLAITKSLVEMMGGKINVTSNYGVGSLFVVIIPQIISDKRIEEKENNINIDYNKYEGLNILLVDDNKINIKVAKKALSNFKFNIDECYDGKSAIDYVKTKKYDLILLDIMMPIMSGKTALKEMQKLDNFNTPVIALTADALSDSKDKYINDGFQDYISKPFSKNDIEKIIIKYIK